MARSRSRGQIAYDALLAAAGTDNHLRGLLNGQRGILEGYLGQQESLEQYYTMQKDELTRALRDLGTIRGELVGDIANGLFGIFQYLRLKQQNENDPVLLEAFVNAHNQDVFIGYFSTLESIKDVDDIFSRDISSGNLYSNINNIIFAREDQLEDQLPVQFLYGEGEGSVEARNRFIYAYYGKNQYERVLANARQQGDAALVAELTQSEDTVTAIKAKLADIGARSSDIEYVDAVIDVIKTVDKPILADAFNQLGVAVVQDINAVFGENQYRRLMWDLDVLPDHSELSSLFSAPENKSKLQKLFGDCENQAACNEVIELLQNPQLTKNEISEGLQSGFERESESIAKKLYRENQYKSLTAQLADRPILLACVERSADAFKAQLEDNPRLATPQLIKALLFEKTSVDDVKAALGEAKIAVNDEQVNEIANENRSKPVTLSPVEQEERIRANPRDNLMNYKDLTKIKEKLERIKAMNAFLDTAQHSRTAVNDTEALEKMDASIKIFKSYVKSCELLNSDLDGEPEKREIIQEMKELSTETEALLTRVRGLNQNQPESIAVIGEPGAKAKIHPDQPGNRSHDDALRELGVFFNGAPENMAANMQIIAENQPTPVWNAGLSRSVKIEYEVNFKSVITGREDRVTLRVGMIQTETKQNPADANSPSSYRQDFFFEPSRKFFEPSGEVKMRKGKPQEYENNSENDKKITIPADHVMRWANDAVQNFKAFADTKGKVVTINAGTMPKRCLEALAIMSKVHDLKFEIKGKKLGITFDELGDKVNAARAIYGTQLQTVRDVLESAVPPQQPRRGI